MIPDYRIRKGPKRVQLSRSKGWRMPANTVKVTRPGKWGNPLKVGQWRGYSAADAVRDYEKWLRRDLTVRSYENSFGRPPSVYMIRKHLRGKNLACWCKLGESCHADVLLRIANS